MRTSTIALGLVAAALSPTLVSCAPFPAADGGSASTSSGGNAGGGTVNGLDGLGLIQLFSGNAGNGGIASSGTALGGSGGMSSSAPSSFSHSKSKAAPKFPKPVQQSTTLEDQDHRNSAASSQTAANLHAGDDVNAGITGSGKKVPEGSVETPPGDALSVFGNQYSDTRGRSMQRSETGGFNLAYMRPSQRKRTNGGPASTGPGGDVSGGTVNGDSNHDNLLADLNILNIGSNNAGDGGDAVSGDALGGSGGRSPAKSNALHSSGAKTVAGSGGPALTSAGGTALGGTVNNPDGIINVFSNNAGDGGDAHSGSAKGGEGGLAL